jgi:hypothetical protein
MEWLHDLTIRLAADAGTDAAPLALDPATTRRLLQIARIAAHTSGDRINAPLLCYVLGMLAAQGYDVERAAALIGEGTDEA